MANVGESGITIRALEPGSGSLDLAARQAMAEVCWKRGHGFEAALHESVLIASASNAGRKTGALERLDSVRQARQIHGYFTGKNAKTVLFILKRDSAALPSLPRMAEALARLGVEAHGIECPPEGATEESLEAGIRSLLSTLPGGELAIAYQNHGTTGMNLPLHDFFVLYANPDEKSDFALAKYLGEAGRRPEPRSAAIIHAETRTKAQFSIVIPTRNGAKYLKHNLRTILEQDFQDYEIVLSDNSSDGNDEIRTLVKSLDSDKIHYHRTPRNLDLPDSFEFAYAKAAGEYAFGIGTDDGLLLHGLSTLSEALAEVGPEADVMKYEHMYFGWPDAQPRMFQYFTRIPMRKKRMRISTESSRELLLSYLDHQASYASLPYGYGEAVLSQRIIQTIKRKTGRLFPSLAQDLFMGCNVLALTDTFQRLAYPITIWGASANCCSIGTVKGGVEYTRWAHTLEYYAGKEKPIKGFYDETGQYQSPYYYHPDVCGFMANDLLYALCAMDLIERKLVPESWVDKINWDSYFRQCVHYIYEDATPFRGILDQMLEKIRRRNLPELEAWFMEHYHANPQFKGVPVPPVEPFNYGLFENNILYLRGNEFGLETIYDAAVFYRNLLHV